MDPARLEKSTNVRLFTLPVPPWLPPALRTVERLSPRLAAAWAERLFTRPRRFAPPAWERRLRARGRAFHLDVRGLRVAALEWGEGETVLLLHGWQGRGTQLGEFVEPLVTRGYHVLAIDAPAHGETAGSSATIVDFTIALAETARRVGAVRATIAHSFGASAAALAAARGAPIGTLVALAPVPSLEGPPRRFLAATGLADRTARLFEARLQRRVGLPFQAVSPLALAPAQRTPLLLVHDREDEEVPVKEALALASAWPGAELVLTSGLGHRGLLRSRATQELVVDHIASGAHGVRSIERMAS